MLIFRIIIISLIFFSFIGLNGQAVTTREVSAQEFQDLVDRLEYRKVRNEWRIKDKFKPKRSKKKQGGKGDEELEDEDVYIRTPGFSGLSGLFTILAYGAILILVAFIIYMIFSNVKLDKKLEPIIDEDDEIEDIEEVDTDNEYRTAVAAGNYRLALRMQFIKFLQLLSAEEKIHWEREKTNRDYHRELTGSELRQNFRELASIYERVWYGEEALNSAEFRLYDQKFITYHNKWR